MKGQLGYRRWLHSGPLRERAGVAVGVALAIGLMVWSVPNVRSDPTTAASATATTETGRGPDAVTTTVPGAAPQGAAPGVTTPGGGPAAVATTTPKAGGAPQAGSGVDPATCDHTATDVGVTKDEVRIGVIVVDLGALNSGLGIDPAEKGRAIYDTLFADVNAHGGLQCRKIVPIYYSDNVLDASGEHATCLQIVQDKVFAVLNNFFSPGEAACVSRQKIPNIWYTPVHTPVVRDLYPYLMAYRADYDSLIRNYILGLNQIGYFNGAGRVGLLIDDCFSDVNQAVFGALARIGYQRSSMSVYDYGCAGSITTPDKHFAAALQMKRDGVTNLLSTAYGVVGGFADAASQQDFKPRYGLMDDNAAALLQNANPPVNSSLDGAVMITSDQTGAENTAGSVFSKATQDCIAASQHAGAGSPLQPGTTAAPLRGLACANVGLLQLVASRTRPLVRTGLAPVLGTLGSVDLAYPTGPTDFRDPKLPAGGQFWRVIRYDSGCTCFKVPDPTWHPSFR